jgi:hypothetical protein
MTYIFAAALALQISNLAGAPPAVVHHAQEEVTRVYADIGVPLEWNGSATDGGESASAIQVVLLPYETGDLRHSDSQVMGAAMRTPSGSAVAYVFYRRVRMEAERYQASTDLVLACAIAHELGHLLLVPMHAHAPAGLMRACWRGDEFRRANQGQLRFLPAEVDRIRAALR